MVPQHYIIPGTFFPVITDRIGFNDLDQPLPHRYYLTGRQGSGADKSSKSPAGVPPLLPIEDPEISDEPSSGPAITADRVLLAALAVLGSGSFRIFAWAAPSFYAVLAVKNFQDLDLRR